jgi:hypothetical protein
VFVEIYEIKFQISRLLIVPTTKILLQNKNVSFILCIYSLIVKNLKCQIWDWQTFFFEINKYLSKNYQFLVLIGMINKYKYLQKDNET